MKKLNLMQGVPDTSTDVCVQCRTRQRVTERLVVHHRCVFLRKRCHFREKFLIREKSVNFGVFLCCVCERG